MRQGLQASSMKGRPRRPFLFLRDGVNLRILGALPLVLPFSRRRAQNPGPSMKRIPPLLLLAILAAGPGTGLTQDRIYRCGNEYTNTVQDAEAKGCKLLEGGNITIIPATRQPSATARAQTASNTRVSESPARDSDTRLILESELKKAEQRQQELLRDYNNGEPEKRPEEVRNYQKYVDRVNELKAALTRNESDMTSIKRELTRLGSSAPAPAR